MNFQIRRIRIWVYIPLLFSFSTNSGKKQVQIVVRHIRQLLHRCCFTPTGGPTPRPGQRVLANIAARWHCLAMTP